ncbi:MAG: alpha/beta fold hydrolase, partial [Maricaulaceae bacterium]
MTDELEPDTSAGAPVAVSDDAAEDGFVDKSHRVPDGLKISYRVYAPTGAPPAKHAAPVVCLHGLTRNLRDFEDVAPYIAAEGRMVVAASMRGRGRSSWDDQPERYAPPTYAADVVSLLDALEIKRAVFVGTSMGGIITMTLAATEPDRVAAVVLNDIGPALSPEGIERIRGYVGKVKPTRTWYQAAQAARRINGPAFPNEREDAFWEAFARRTCIETPDGVVPAYDPAIAGPIKAAGGAMPFWPV